MALAEICGLDRALYMRWANEDHRKHNRELLQQASNIDNPLHLIAPPYINPYVSWRKFHVPRGASILPSTPPKEENRIHYLHGTTTLSFIYNGGICVAVDSRATGGNFIGSQTMKKVVEINKYMLGTMAGGAADCVYWDRVLSARCRLHELRTGNRISISATSKMMSNIIHNMRGMNISMGMMLAGFDENGPDLYFIDAEGNRIKGDLFAVGSGSLFAISILDGGYKPTLDQKEATELARRSIYHATRKDAYSGGIIRVYHIDSNGWKNISNTDCMELHYMYEEGKTLDIGSVATKKKNQ